jgi:hypothetical protein
MLILWTGALLLWQPDVWGLRGPVRSVFLAAEGVVGITLWLLPRDGRIPRQRLWAGGFLVAFLALLGATLVDWPIWPDALPEPLLQAAAGRPDVLRRFHSYNMSAFLGHELVWRIDARPEQLHAIASKLELSRVDEAPPEFWRMPPHYWPRSLPPGAQLYSTREFSRGAGDQYFMLVDPRRELALVWVRSYFY